MKNNELKGNKVGELPVDYLENKNFSIKGHDLVRLFSISNRLRHSIISLHLLLNTLDSASEFEDAVDFANEVIPYKNSIKGKVAIDYRIISNCDAILYNLLHQSEWHFEKAPEKFVKAIDCFDLIEDDTDNIYYQEYHERLNKIISELPVDNSK